MSTIKTPLWYYFRMPQLNTKHLIAAGVVLVLLLLLGAFALSGGNNTWKNTSVPAIVPPTAPSENTAPAGTISEPDQIPEDPVFVPASECKSGQTLNKAGECVEVEVEQVEEPAQLATDYTRLLYPYEERNREMNQVLWGDGKYSRVLEYEAGKNLLVSFGFLDDNGNWKEEKRFVTTIVYNASNSGGAIKLKGDDYDYNGSFVKLDDPSYTTSIVSFWVWIDPIRLNPCCSSYESGNEQFRTCIVPTDLSPVVYTGI